MATYKTIIYGQEVEVTVIDPVDFTRAKEVGDIASASVDAESYSDMSGNHMVGGSGSRTVIPGVDHE